MPESKTLILGAVIILLGLLASALLIDKAIILSESYELEMNASWDDGWYNGYEWGAYDTFEETMRNGIYVLNETWVIYSPEGCLRAIEYEGCEVVCAGPK